MTRYSNKLKIINKNFCYSWSESIGSDGVKVSHRKEITPNPFEVSKQFCILRASGKSLELPCSYNFWNKWEDDYPDFSRWCEAVCDKCYDIEAISKMDFSKPFDEEVVKAAIGKKLEENKLKVDVSDIIEAELSEE